MKSVELAEADAAQIINPKGLEMQIEGGVIQSVSWTLKDKDRHPRTETYPFLSQKRSNRNNSQPRNLLPKW